MTTRVCKKCKRELPLDSYGVKRSNVLGRNTRCPDCIREDKADYYQNNKELVKRKTKADHEKNRVRNSARQMRYDKNFTQTPERKARVAVRNAVTQGVLVAPENCERCNATGRLEAHHEDYSLQLKVEWLCNDCHKGEHND